MPDWVDITTIGSTYREQMDPTSGKRRHRSMIGPPESDIDNHPDDGWTAGPAPRSPIASKKSDDAG